ncbi:sigma-70 family RNA polymerase sigma factor [bacterium]|nr:sigma-70 family RNA polymerase sigma factor [bacterium]
MIDDSVLVQRCLANEVEAIRTFVDRFQGLVFGLCFRMLQQREDAEDVTQETFTRAFRHLRQWQPERSLKPWVMAIAANRCRTRLARRLRQPQSSGDWQDVATTNATSPGLAEELEKALESLREDHRLCFVMFYQQELSIQEISEALDCPTGTVKTWLHRARKQMAEQLQERGVVNRDGYELHRF